MKTAEVMFLPGDKVYLNWELDLGSFTAGEVVETRIHESETTYLVKFNDGRAEYREHELADAQSAKQKIIEYYKQQIAKLEAEG